MDATHALRAHVERNRARYLDLLDREPGLAPHLAAGLDARARRLDRGAAALGGALPLAPFVQTLGLPCFGIPFANPDAGNHGPNENIELSRFIDGIVTAGVVLREIAAWDPR